jgi:hypothetical protein
MAMGLILVSRLFVKNALWYVGGENATNVKSGFLFSTLVDGLTFAVIVPIIMIMLSVRLVGTGLRRTRWEFGTIYTIAMIVPNLMV